MMNSSERKETVTTPRPTETGASSSAMTTLERKVDFNEAKQASAQSQAAALADKPLTKAHGLAQHAQHALAVIHKQKLSKEDQDMVIQETVTYWKDHVNQGFLTYRKSMSDDYTGVEWDDYHPGSACFRDVRGRIFIDCLGGFGIYNVGHRHPVVLAAVRAQLNKQALHSQELLDPLRSYCAHLLSLIMPGNGKLNKFFFTNSGTESVEAVLKMAILSTGRKRIVALVSAFHGKTLGALATTSKALFRTPFLGALLNVTHVPINDLVTLKAVFAASKFTGDEIAGLIIEPIQGEGGIHICTNEYLQAARKLCDEYGSLLIFDEVQSGMGRTGKYFFACEHANVVPDLMAIGKAFGGGVMPSACACGTDDVWKKYIENPFIMTTTFGGNPLAMAASIATINVILTEKLTDAAEIRGKQFMDGLRALQKQFPEIIKEVRGRGLMIGLEFITNDLGCLFSKGLYSRNVLVSGTLVNALVIRIEPPLTIKEDEINTVLGRCHETLEEIKAHLKSEIKK